MAFHRGDRFVDVRRMRAQTFSNTASLWGRSAANIGVQKPVADQPRKYTAMVTRNQRMHQIKRRNPATASNAVAINHKKLPLNQGVRKPLCQRRCVLPMHSKPPSSHKPGIRQHHGAAGHTPDADTLTRTFPQPFENRLVPKREWIAPGDNQKQVQIDRFPHPILPANGRVTRTRNGRNITEMNDLVERTTGQQISRP